MNVAIDLGGVVTRYPKEIRYLVEHLLDGGAMIHFVTDCPPARAEEILALAGITPHVRIQCHCVVWTGDESKKEVLKKIKADIFIDDHLGYILGAEGGARVRLLVVPSPSEPYDCLKDSH